MKSILFNGFSLTEKETYGVQRYTVEILRELDKVITNEKVYLAVPANGIREYSFENIKVIKVGTVSRSKNLISKKIHNKNWINKELKRIAKQYDCYVVDTILCFPGFGADIIAIHDCIPDLFPQYYRTLINKYGRFQLLRKQHKSVKKCKFIITVSESAKSDIVRLYKVDPNKIIVIPNAWQHFEKVDEDITILERLGVNKNEFFFSLGSRLPHKNLIWLAHVAQNNPDLKFIVSGSDFGKRDDTLDETALDNLIFAGYLSDSEVKALMRNCKAFIQPSLYEGFGIPPMEAMSVGAKCIVSDRSSLPEIYEKSVWYLNPDDYDNTDILGMMSTEIEDNKYVLDKYSWEKNAKLMYNLLKKL